MTQKTTPPALPPLFFGEHALYNFIMEQIEPELTTEGTKTLDEKYKSETPEERQVRAARYEKAFKLYDQRFAEYNAYWNKQMKDHQTAVMKNLEIDSLANDEADAAALEHSILSQ